MSGEFAVKLVIAIEHPAALLGIGNEVIHNGSLHKHRRRILVEAELLNHLWTLVLTEFWFICPCLVFVLQPIIIVEVLLFFSIFEAFVY